MFDVIVIGGGPAGVTAALRASELGAQVALIERDRMGGTCTNDGCVPTRVLARAARLMRDAEQFSDYGLVAAPPTVDFRRLLVRAQQVVYSVHEKKQLVDHLHQAGVKVIASAGGAQFVDAHTVALPDGTRLEGEKFIICAGGHARRFDFPGSEHALTHHDVWSLAALPRSVAIVGAAATGCQLASILDAFGVEVWLLEVAPRILGAEDELTSRVMEDAFTQRGIHVVTSIGGVERIEQTGEGRRLWYTQQGESQAVDVEAVILAVGWVGNSGALGLPAAGVETQRGYIVVDDYMRTSVPHIFAAGDITGRMMLVQSGSHDARVAAENAVLGVGQPYSHQIVPHGGFTDPEYAGVGLTEEQARAEHDCLVAVVPYADLDRAVIDGYTDGFCKLIISQETHRILGAHVVGEQAVEIIQLVATGMAADIWIEQFAELELAYPTYAAIIGLVARRLVRDLGVTPVVPEWCSLCKPAAAEWERSAE